MAEKELPPLRVRIVGDSGSYDKVMKTAIAQAQQLQSIFNKITFNAQLTQARQLSSALRSMNNVSFRKFQTQADSLITRFSNLDRILSSIQKKTFGKGVGGGSGAWAAASASIGKSISDAFTKASPHIAKTIQQAFKTSEVILRNAFNSANVIIRSAANVFRAIAASATNSLRAVTTALSNTIRSASNVIVTAMRVGGQIAATAIRAGGQMAAAAIRGVMQLVNNIISQTGRVISQAIRSAGQVASQAIRSAGQVASQTIRSAGNAAARAISAAVQGYSITMRALVSVISTVGRTIVGLGRSASTVISTSIRAAGQSASQAIRGASQMGSAAIRGASQMGATAIRSAGQIISQAIRSSARAGSSTRGASGGGSMGGLGGGLTSRADIYMHANAMKALATSGRGLIDLRANLQYAEVGIQAFTNNAQQASQIMSDLRDHAEKTSFTQLGLAEATRNMMAYGISAKDAVPTIKMLGDVAGGNEMRFERLAFAMSQITSMGRLQGQELRQLTEQGFNPLETMSRRTGKSMLELKDMMESGLITSAHVTEALKIETAAGGRFANMQKIMANSLGGVRSQLAEVASNIKVELVKVMEKDLIATMKKAIGYLKLFQTYLKSPAGQAMATKMVSLAKSIFVAVFAFHAVGFAMASFMWFLSSIGSTVTRILSVFRILSVAISVVAGIVSSPFALIVLGAGAAVAALAYLSGAISGPSSVYQAFIDLWNMLSAFFTATVGFFYNFGDNWIMLSEWFRRNWKNIIGDLMEGTVRVVSAMISNFMTLVRMVGRLFVVFFTWIVTSFTSLFDTQVYDAVVNGFIRIFTWLESKWKDFGNFVSDLWENLFDPAALYDILTKGMGIQKTATKMADDITTTMEKGLFAGINGVVKDEMGNLKTGLEDMAIQTEALPQFNTTMPQAPVPPKAPELGDAAAYKGPGFAFGMGGAVGKTADTMAFGSSDYNKKLAEQAARFDFSGKPKSANPQLAAQLTTNTLLQKILNAMLTGNPIPLIPAAVGGGSNTP